MFTVRRSPRRSAVAAFTAAFLLSIVGVLPVAADSTPQTPPFSQSWANTGLITTSNDWSGVPGLIGYLGQNLTSTTGVDPQAVTAVSSVAEDIHVIPNQTNPNTLTTGGFAEFETLSDPVVALQGSGTADAPFLLLALNTTGLANVNVAYNLRDIDGSADNAIQPMALQYRVGASIGYTNLPAGFVPDATSGPSLATLVTPISVTLPAAASNQPLVEVRIITTNAAGSDEWVGVDDVSITASAVDPAPSVASSAPADGAVDVPIGSSISITFSEPVDVTGSWFSIACATSLSHSATVSGGPDTYTLNPDSDFANGELCTVTVFASNVTDQDTNDPPDNMSANHTFGFTTAAVLPGAPAIYFSEYIEGTSNNKALEIFNGTGAPVDLTAEGWNVQMFFNGNSAATLTINLSGAVAAGDVFVVAQASASAAILAQADQTNGSGWFNGDDAVVLRKGTTVVDVIGQVGFDPGTEWGTGLTSTADNTLRRKASVTVGDPNGTDAFDPSVEWDGFATDTFGGLGFHGEQPFVISTSPAKDATGVALATNVAITFTEPVNVTGTWFTLTCASSGAHSATVSGGPVSFGLDPDTDFDPNELCTVTVLAANVTDQDTNDPPDNMSANYVFSFMTADVLVCGAPATFIHDVQGNGATSPIAGSGVTIEGVVVGDYQATPSEFGGFYLQEEGAQADADPLTSEGIFVFDGNFGVAVNHGDVVRVRGTVLEFFDLTELTAVSAVAVCATGTALPAATPVSLPVAAVADHERAEGMLVQFSQTLTATEVFNLGRFGEVSLSGAGRLYTGTAVAAPGGPALAVIDQNNRSRIILDDGNNQQNIDPTRYPQGGLSASNTLRVGDTLPGLTGVMDYRFNAYRIQPIGPISFNHDNARTAAPEPVGGNLRVASFNVLNFFNGDGTGLGFPTARGATTQAELDRQTSKLVSALTAIDADIVGLMEIENDATPNSAIEELVGALNAATAPGTYGFIDTGVVGTDEIRVALIYKPAAVTPVGSHAVITSAVDPDFIDTLNRPSLAQTFERNATGARLTVVVNHLKSKGSDCNAVGDPDIGDGQGNCNVTRQKAAGALVDWLATDPTGSGDPDVLIIGDLNSYTFEDPITTITGAGYTNLVAAFGGNTAYSYVFNGESGYLDHGLATASLVAQVAGAVEWHINPDEPTVLDYNVEFKTPNHVNTLYDPGPYRASDHDPVVVGLELNANPAVDAGGPYAVIEGDSVVVSATGSDPDGQALTYAWDLDGNGTFETPGQSATFSAAGLQAPATLTIRAQVTDPGGLTATDEATVNVIWDFGGFLPPITASGRDVKAGKTIPVKFSLDGDQGMAIFRAGYPASEAFTCGTTPPADATVPAILASPTGFYYDASKDEYVFEWKTDKAWKDTCRVFVLGLADGTTHNVTFHFK